MEIIIQLSYFVFHHFITEYECLEVISQLDKKTVFQCETSLECENSVKELKKEKKKKKKTVYKLISPHVPETLLRTKKKKKEALNQEFTPPPLLAQLNTINHSSPSLPLSTQPPKTTPSQAPTPALKPCSHSQSKSLFPTCIPRRCPSNPPPAATHSLNRFRIQTSNAPIRSPPIRAPKAPERRKA